MAPEHEDTLFVGDQTGQIWAVDVKQGGRKLFADLSGRMITVGLLGFKYYDERGLLGLAFLGMMAIIFGALGAFGQNDFKRLVAYSSINHMGFVVLGIAAAAWALGVDKASATLALNGAVLQMFNHGLSAAGMFFLVGVIYERTHTRDLKAYGGLFPLVPVYGGMLIFTAMGSLGLPGLGGFVSEFLVVRGAWPIFTLATVLGMIGLFFTGAYILKALKMVLHGPLNEHWVGHLTEINPREMVVIVPLMALMLAVGVWPAWLLDVINKAVSLFFKS